MCLTAGQISTRLSPFKRRAALLKRRPPRLLGVDGEAFSRALERLDGADSAQKLSWQQFRRVVASLAILAKADLALSPLSPATIESTFPDDDDDTVEPPPPPPPDSPPPRIDVPRRETSTRRLCLRTRRRPRPRAASRRSPRASTPSRPRCRPRLRHLRSLLCHPLLRCLHHPCCRRRQCCRLYPRSRRLPLSPASALSPAPRPPSFHAEETPARRLRPRADDGPSASAATSPPAWTERPRRREPVGPPAGLEARREDGAWAETGDGGSPSSPWDEAPQSEVASPSSPTAWAETLEELRADPDSPIGQLVFGDAAEDDAADADAASAARERRELENRDAATVRALELAVARAEAATAGRAEAEAALAEVEARAFDVQRATRNLERDVERLTGERDAAIPLRAAVEEGPCRACPVGGGDAVEEARRARPGGIGGRPLGPPAARRAARRAAALRELQRGIRRVRASRFLVPGLIQLRSCSRDVTAALGAKAARRRSPAAPSTRAKMSSSWSRVLRPPAGR